MSTTRDGRRAVVVFLLSVLPPAICWSIGCRSTQKMPAVSDRLPDSAAAARSLTPLEKIEPAIEQPHAPADLIPLSDRSEKQLVAASQLIAEQRYTEAALQLERALRYDPDHARIHGALGVLHWQAGNVERAKTHAGRAAEKNPDDAVAHYVLARCHAQAGDAPSAITSLRRALLCGDFDKDPAMASLCHHALAELLTREGYLAAALAQYQAFERTSAQVTARAGDPAGSELQTILARGSGAVADAKAEVLEKLGRFGEAADCLSRSAEQTPGDAGRAMRHARLLLKADRLDEAIEAARRIPPDHADGALLLLEVFQRAGRLSDAVAEIHARLENTPDSAQLALALSKALNESGNAQAGRRELQHFLDAHPDSMPVRAALLDAFAAESAWKDVLRLSAEGLRIAPEAGDAIEERLQTMTTNEAFVAAVLNAVDDDPGDAFTAYLRGKVALAANRRQLAEELLRTSAAAQSAPALARTALAELLIGDYRYDEALNLLSPKDDPTAADAQRERVLGLIHDRLDNLEEAERHYRTAVQHDRSDVATMLALAEMYLRTDRLHQAQRQLRVLLEADPEHEPARELLALTYLQENKPDIAREEYAELRKHASKPTTIARCDTILDPTLQRDSLAKRERFLKALQSGPEDAPTWIAVAATYEDNNLDAIYDAYRNAARLDPGDDDIAFTLSRLEQNLLRFEDAAARMKELMRHRPNRHMWRLRLAGLHRLVTDFDAALAEYAPYVDRADLPAKVSAKYREGYVETLNDLGRIDEASAKLEAWMNADPDDAELAGRLTRQYQLHDRAKDAVALTERYYKQNAGDWQVREGLFEALIRAKMTDRAAQFVLDWLDEDPENDVAWSMLAGATAGAGRLDEALEIVRTQAVRSLRRQWYQDFWVLELSKAGGHDEAVEVIEGMIDAVLAVLRKGPTLGGPRWRDQLRDDEMVYQPDAPFSLETLQLRLETLRTKLIGELVAGKRFRRAEQLLDEWLNAAGDPKSRYAYLWLSARCRQAQNQAEAAAAAMERALVLQPADVGLNNDLAYTWIDQGRRLDEAERMIRYAVAREPGRAAYLDTFGWLLYKKDQFAEARKWILRASRTAGGKDPVLFDHLGDACFRMGATAEAIEHWTEAQRLAAEKAPDAPTSDDERRVRQTVQQKIDDARAGRAPKTAPAAGESAEPQSPAGGP